MIIIKTVLLFFVGFILWFIWEFDKTCKFLGYRGWIEFLLFYNTGSSDRALERRMKDKLHQLFYQGMRAVDAVHDEHGEFHETVTLKDELSKLKKQFETKDIVKLPYFHLPGLRNLTSASGRKLQTFISDWRRFKRALIFLKEPDGE